MSMNQNTQLKINNEAPVAIKRTLITLSGNWTLYILWVLHKFGPSRFKDLEDRVEGISPRMLTERLRKLTSNGLIKRVQSPTASKVTYELTPKGEALAPVLKALEDIATQWETH